MITYKVYQRVPFGAGDKKQWRAEFALCGPSTDIKVFFDADGYETAEKGLALQLRDAATEIQRIIERI